MDFFYSVYATNFCLMGLCYPRTLKSGVALLCGYRKLRKRSWSSSPSWSSCTWWTPTPATIPVKAVPTPAATAPWWTRRMAHLRCEEGLICSSYLVWGFTSSVPVNIVLGNGGINSVGVHWLEILRPRTTPLKSGYVKWVGIIWYPGKEYWTSEISVWNILAGYVKDVQGPSQWLLVQQWRNAAVIVFLNSLSV